MSAGSEGGRALHGLRVLVLEARRGEELERMLRRHGAEVMRAPALREAAVADAPEARELAARLEQGSIDLVVLLTGVGTRGLVTATGPSLVDGLGRVPIVARGPKPLAALRELGIGGAHAVPSPHTWRETVAVIDRLGLAPGSTVAVQEYGAAPSALLEALAVRGLRALRVPVYRWTLPDDTAPLRAAIDALVRRAVHVTVFTNAVQVEHLFRLAIDPNALRAALAATVVASVGPVCSEALEAHGVPPDLEADPPKMGPLVALVADRARTVLAGRP
jgi:uroporphyrinogen-III synthase